MRSATVGVLAASALTAQAILLPPGVATESGWNSPFAIDTTNSQIKLPCPECVPTTSQEKIENEGSDDIISIQGGAMDVLLNFSIEDAHTLSLNGYPLFSDGHLDPSLGRSRPVISQVPSSASLIEIKEAAVPVQTLQVTKDGVVARIEPASPSGDAVVRVTYEIFWIDGHIVTVPGAEVTMLKSAEGELMILNVEPAPKHRSIFDSLPPHDSDAGAPAPKKCNDLVCKLNDMMSHVGNSIDSAFKDFKAGAPKMKGGCHGRKPGFTTHGTKEDGRPGRHHGRPPKMPGMHPHGHHGPHGHHRHHGHHMMHRIVHRVLSILVPIFVGMTMGFVATAIGMAIGRLISFLWIKFVRGGQRGYASVAQEESDVEEAVVDEKTVCTKTEVDEPLPTYEDAPAYEEVQSEQK
ncbi:hypothetical protein MBLNU457_1551t1 [Dothideomycetes sp. NU457]